MIELSISQCRIMKNVIPGEVYAIPLFLYDVHDMHRVTLNVLRGKDSQFAYCRIIADLGSAGFLIEVFTYIGGLNIDVDRVVNSNRLFPPVSITGLGIIKGRWRKIGKQVDYNAERDSVFSEITLVSGTPGHYFLWKGGQHLGWIADDAISLHEKWRCWRASQLERRIIKALAEEGMSF